MPEFITPLFTSKENKPWVIGGAAVGAALTIAVMVITLVRSFRNK